MFTRLLLLHLLAEVGETDRDIMRYHELVFIFFVSHGSWLTKIHHLERDTWLRSTRCGSIGVSVLSLADPQKTS